MANLVEVFVGVSLVQSNSILSRISPLNCNKQAATMKCIELPHFFQCWGRGYQICLNECFYAYLCHQFLQYLILYQLWIVDLKHVLNYSIHSRSKMSMVLYLALAPLFFHFKPHPKLNKQFNSLSRTFFGKQQLRNGLDNEWDLMRFNTYTTILNQV